MPKRASQNTSASTRFASHLEGLSLFLKVNRDTLYTWAKEHPEFSDILDDLRNAQAEKLINNGLSGDYNPTIAKLILTKHGYHDKVDADHTTKGEPIRGFNYMPPHGDADRHTLLLATAMLKWNCSVSDALN